MLAMLLPFAPALLNWTAVDRRNDPVETKARVDESEMLARVLAIATVVRQREQLAAVVHRLQRPIQPAPAFGITREPELVPVVATATTGRSNFSKHAARHTGWSTTKKSKLSSVER